MPKNACDDGIQGEVAYATARRSRGPDGAFVRQGPVDEKAREVAEALDRPEAGEIEAARRSTAAGDVRGREKRPRPEGSQRPDARLDERLEQTYPASDPASISPGSD
jgi:hypothetical protein